MLTALTNAIIFTGKSEINGKTLLIEDDRIRSVSDLEIIPKGVNIIDCKGSYIAPGLIDLQVAGGGGYLILISEEEIPNAIRIKIRLKDYWI